MYFNFISVESWYKIFSILILEKNKLKYLVKTEGKNGRTKTLLVDVNHKNRKKKGKNHPAVEEGFVISHLSDSKTLFTFYRH